MMGTETEVIALLVTALIVPFVVQLIRHEALTGRAAFWVATCVSVLAGLVSGFIGGIPANAVAWVTCIFAAVGGVQVAYAAFRGIGITNKWLDALADVHLGGE